MVSGVDFLCRRTVPADFGQLISFLPLLFLMRFCTILPLFVGYLGAAEGSKQVKWN